MANISKAEKRALAAEKKERRRKAAEEVMDARMRTAVGFGMTYVLTQALPAIAPSLAEYQGTIDLGTAVVGGYLALTDDSEMGDYALGAALVGSTQTLDTVGAAINDWLAR
jgi:hypothetical protein